MENKLRRLELFNIRRIEDFMLKIEGKQKEGKFYIYVCGLYFIVD